MGIHRDRARISGPVRWGTFLLLLGSVLAGFGGLGAEQDIYSRRAVEAPPETRSSFATKEEGDEIDRQIEQYFSGIESTGKIDIDERKLEQLFGPSGELAGEAARYEAEGGRAGTYSYANVGSQDSGVAAHKVKKGETIWSISRRYNMKPAQIVQHNPELKKRPLYIGEEVLIVRTGHQKGPVKAKAKTKVRYITVKKGDTLSHISRRYRVSQKNLRSWNRLNSKGTIRIGQKLKIVSRGKSGPPPGYKYGKFFDWPLRGTITSGYGRRSNPFVGSRRQYHRGIDIGARMGTPIRAARDGVVIMSRRMGGYGNCIFIRHSNGYVSVYAHNMVNKVREGDVVKRGALIGKVGRTGSATGPHLHFEIRRWKKPINPISALNMKELVRKKVAAR